MHGSLLISRFSLFSLLQNKILLRVRLCPSLHKVSTEVEHFLLFEHGGDGGEGGYGGYEGIEYRFRRSSRNK